MGGGLSPAAQKIELQDQSSLTLQRAGSLEEKQERKRERERERERSNIYEGGRQKKREREREPTRERMKEGKRNSISLVCQ